MIQIKTGDDLSYMAGAQLRLWNYYSSHDQLFLRIRLNDTYGTLHMLGCLAVRLPTACELNAPTLTPLPDNPSRYFRFSDAVSGVEVTCHEIWLDPENDPDDYWRLHFEAASDPGSRS